MSKLNDSTLKILKKYRLDTDMSVFGNENKLYDVVKVMDDMVGNQVGKYIGQLPFWDSIKPETSTRYYYFLQGSQPTYKRITSNIKVNTKPDFEYCYCLDPLSLKLIQNNAKFTDKFLVGFCFNTHKETICYLGLVANGNNFEYGLFKDLDMTDELTTETLPEGFSVATFTYVSDKEWKQHIALKNLSDFFPNITTYSINYIPDTTFGYVYLPSYITKSFYTTLNLTGNYLTAFSQVVKGEII